MHVCPELIFFYHHGCSRKIQTHRRNFMPRYCIAALGFHVVTLILALLVLQGLHVLVALVDRVGRQRGDDCLERGRLVGALTEVPARAAEILNHDEQLIQIAHDIAEARDVLYLGRGTSYPLALEGALKLKEISYIHAEGYAAGEMKHGPIALIDETVPVVVVAPTDNLIDKTVSNVQEVMARGGRVIFLSDVAGVSRLGGAAEATVTLPAVDPFVAPLLYAIPVQLLAYHIGVIKGTDVDQPRNLAKSVTVE